MKCSKVGKTYSSKIKLNRRQGSSSLWIYYTYGYNKESYYYFIIFKALSNYIRYFRNYKANLCIPLVALCGITICCVNKSLLCQTDKYDKSSQNIIIGTRYFIVAKKVHQFLYEVCHGPYIFIYVHAVSFCKTKLPSKVYVLINEEHSIRITYDEGSCSIC